VLIIAGVCSVCIILLILYARSWFCLSDSLMKIWRVLAVETRHL
jgi:hypothetical protein